ncbi:DNA cytosine methyltransferase [Marinicella sp. W31]|uniref:DNA cytosine methyltransferase n=1 Tax=Marinicella sp. W31 TaxID=3023713 RepID=UPI0037569180
MDQLVLSLFPGVDLLSKPFTESGFTIVKGPELAFGEDIRDFKLVTDKFNGIIAGTPCQDFSQLRRINPTGYGIKMIKEFQRCVIESNVDWFLLENVSRAPNVKITGYKVQRFEMDLGWFEPYSRLRHFQFGCKNGNLLNPPKLTMRPDILEGAVVAKNDQRSFRQMCDIQGLPENYDLPHFNESGKKIMIGNGVPIRLGRELVKLIKRDYYKIDYTAELKSISKRRCKCGCGRIVIGRKKYFAASCRKRAQRARDNQIKVTMADPENYLGSKGGAGVKQTIINHIPPHMTFIELFLGSGEIMKNKRPAIENIGVDLNERMLKLFENTMNAKLLCMDGFQFLKQYPFNNTEFLYLDPPYLHETRTSNIRYEYEYSKSDHKRLLQLVKTLDTKIMISGYASALYDSELSTWYRKEFTSMTRRGKRTEVIWMNYDLSGTALHDTQYVGSNMTDRQRIKRKVDRWSNKFQSLEICEKQLLLESLLKKYS